MKTFTQALVTACAVLALSGAVEAADPVPDGQPPSVTQLAVGCQFQDHMVLQREMQIPISGTAEPEAKVKVAFKGQVKETVTNKDGTWSITLDPLPADKQPAVMTIEGTTGRIELKDILVGDVWFCSGQSNSAMGLYWLQGQKHRPPEQFESQKELLDTAEFPHIRLHRSTMGDKAGYIGGLEIDTWSHYTPKSTPEASMVGLYFSREIARSQDIPVGLIQVAMGGCSADVFMSRETLETLPYMKWRLRLGDRLKTPGYSDEERKTWRAEIQAEWKMEREDAAKRGERGPIDQGGGNYWNPQMRRVVALPSDLWPNIERWTSFPIKGVIWYQGENDHGDSQYYAETMTALIASWRKAWNQGDFPFLLVQLPGHSKKQEKPNEGGWANIREAQADILSKAPNTGMVVTYDSGEEKDIHPYDKHIPGKRLGLLARSMVYEENVVASGPAFKSMTVDGPKVTLAFDHVGGGLATRDAEPLKGFAVLVKSTKPPHLETWEWAKAEIKGDTVELTIDGDFGPIQSVRYAWASFPIGNLYCKEGLPAAPFRTDR
jgi:sialate O-acetylesterase